MRDVESEDRPDSGIKVDVEPLCAGISIHDRLHTLEGVSWQPTRVVSLLHINLHPVGIKKYHL